VVALVRLLTPGFVGEQKRRRAGGRMHGGGTGRSRWSRTRRLREDPALVVSVSHRDIERGGSSPGFTRAFRKKRPGRGKLSLPSRIVAGLMHTAGSFHPRGRPKRRYESGSR
jgi:hypothetical protein